MKKLLIVTCFALASALLLNHIQIKPSLKILNHEQLDDPVQVNMDIRTMNQPVSEMEI